MTETDRTVVKTYVPEYQKETWQAHADDLDMSQSEFLRSMVQAGRRVVDADGDRSLNTEPKSASEEPGSPASNPGGQGLETRVLELLETAGPTDWAELLDALSEELETKLEACLDDLQQANRIQYSGRDGGYTLVGGPDE